MPRKPKVDYHPTPLTRGQRAFVRRNWALGYSAGAIARALQISPKRVTAHARSYGLPKRLVGVPRMMAAILPPLAPFKAPRGRPEKSEPNSSAPSKRARALWDSPLPGLARRGAVPWSALKD